MKKLFRPTALSGYNVISENPSRMKLQIGLRHFSSSGLKRTIIGGDKTFLRTHYDILGVKEGAAYEEIRTRYRSSILNYHPDKVPKTDGLFNSLNMAGDRFLEIQRAWEILGNPTSRAVYDIELQTLKQDATTSEDVGIEDLTIEYAGDVVELLYQCRCGDCFSIDSVELEEMGYILSRDGDTISLQTLNSFPASVVLPCGSCSLKIRLLINNAENI